ncbi:alpha-amylase family glycosyl hydrolase [Candidatus Nanohalovita haloferacivicina]|uniref:alpha-amylase family glycosyl hydrolase n=1 Tax=Candidatus Nanohalovita haloferacivicina TaxID=2978046 RepID=UPI00325FD192|nr:Alpha amylase catalytic domain, glycosyl hydrolase family 13 [Candidatus Nanohalobia archaeon BNXNv]
MAREWFQNSVVYQIFIDRFAGFEDGSNWHNPEYVGGDIRGIIERLDYIEELGVDVIWISPFYQNEAYHGYHVTDFFSVDENFGTEEDLKELIEEVHDRDMKIVADFVPNHCSVNHPYFVEARNNPGSEFVNWFCFDDWPDHYKSFLDFDSVLAKIDLDYEPARNHVIAAAKKWLELGLDGYRLDHVIGPSDEFWQVFEKEIHDEFEDAVLIGEAAWDDSVTENSETVNMERGILGKVASQEYTQKNYEGLLDGVLDFKFRDLLLGTLNSSIMPDIAIRPLLKAHYAFFSSDFMLTGFMDNHDVNRALYELGQDKEKLKKGLEIMLSIDQPCVIYYGTEIGMTQHHSITEFPSYGDLQARQPMQWNDMDGELLEYFREKINNR